jgi:hypothetical protein
MNAVIRDAIYFHLREYAERLENYILWYV